MAQRSWGHENQSSCKIKAGYKSIQIFKDQLLGMGSYGQVCKAKCDDLLCAAKMLYPILFYREPMAGSRFEQECEFLSTLRHPNIVQYIGMHRDPDTNLPVLLMELMDENLTHYLEHCSQSVPYHLQVNICHDVASALSYIHANDIVHRDVSSNSILVNGNAQVTKLSDFNMSGFDISNRDDLTVCPGSQVYVPHGCPTSARMHNWMARYITG